MNVRISELRSVVNLLLDYVEEQAGGSIDVEPDAYWFVSKDSAYDPCAETSELTMGQLSDDREKLKGILDKQDDPVGYAMVWASSLMRALGDQIP